MSDNHEFSYQSSKQKITLLVVKGIVLLLLADSLYSLGWQSEQSWHDKLVSIAGVLMAFWAYSTLLQVRTEIKELLVPPANFSHAQEFMLAALAIYVFDMLRICFNILQLHGVLGY